MATKGPDAAKAANDNRNSGTQANVNPWASLAGANNEYSLYLSYMNASTDPVLKAQTYADIISYLNKTASPTGQGGMGTYLQQLLRAQGYSKGKGAAQTAEDAKGLDAAISGAIRNQAGLFSFLANTPNSSGGGTGAKAQDTTPRYSKQISTALKMKDYGDAQNMLYDAYYQTFGSAPSRELISKFQNSWNAEAAKQEKPTTTDYITTYEKSVDPKTGKVIYDANGLPTYKSITKQISSAQGEGFTDDEQKQFLANYLSTNFPDDNLDPTKIGGVTKSIYDDLTATYKNNFQPVPDVATLAPVIKQIIGSGDADTAKTILEDTKNGIRSLAATKYMGIAEYVNAGKDASEYVNPLIKQASEFLEIPLDINDPLIKQALNYQAPDKTYRLMNDYEMSEALVNDSRYGKTSKAKNEAVNLAQAITSKLGI